MSPSSGFLLLVIMFEGTAGTNVDARRADDRCTARCEPQSHLLKLSLASPLKPPVIEKLLANVSVELKQRDVVVMPGTKLRLTTEDGQTYEKKRARHGQQLEPGDGRGGRLTDKKHEKNSTDVPGGADRTRGPRVHSQGQGEPEARGVPARPAPVDDGVESSSSGSPASEGEAEIAIMRIRELAEQESSSLFWDQHGELIMSQMREAQRFGQELGEQSAAASTTLPSSTSERTGPTRS